MIFLTVTRRLFVQKAYMFFISFYIYIHSWPPSEDEFREKETAIPTVTETFLEGILSKREKKVQRLIFHL